MASPRLIRLLSACGLVLLFGTASGAESARATTRLFLDWANVFSGRVEPAFDRERVTPDGFSLIAREEKEWGIVADLSGHRMKRNRLPHGVRISVEKARKSLPWLQADRPWEKQLAWVTVIHEGGRYRCWYYAFPAKLGPGVETMLCYAESLDGVTWRKPHLGVFSFTGAEKNNIVSIWNHESAVFLDETAPAAERYKTFIWDKTPPSTARADPSYGLYGVVSADGYRWHRLPDVLLSDFHDTQNIAYWDAERRKYVAYLRGAQNGRAISYAETADFRKWPQRATVILHPGALDAPFDDYYTNGFTHYPGERTIRLFFSSIYHHASDLVDVRLGITHNGRAINWVSYEPIVEVGSHGDPDAGAVFAGPNLVQLPDGMLALPYRGMNYTHNEWYYTQYYDATPRPGEQPRTVSFAWALWDEGRLAGIEADNTGEFWTKVEKLETTQILLNARTRRSGSIEVELWEPTSRREARPIPGYGFADFEVIQGDARWVQLAWKGKPDLSELKGRSVQMRMRLNSAKVFGYRLMP